MSPSLLPLHAAHVALGARLGEAAGWTMPLEFAGVFREYRALRSDAVVWDCSNLGRIEVRGPGAFDLVHRTFTNDLRRCAPGHSQYTFLLDPDDGGIVDELMVFHIGPEAFLLTPNRPAVVLEALRARAGAAPDRQPVTLEDRTGEDAVLALQGARARERMAVLVPAAAELARARIGTFVLGHGPHGPGGGDGAEILVSTTAFGGRIGFELHMSPDTGRAVYGRLLEAGCIPVGLGLRETHRFEAGIARFEVDIGPDCTPLEAGSARAVAFDTEFVGREALRVRRERDRARILRTIVLCGRRIPTAGSTLLLGERVIGEITSGNYSPALHRGLAFAFLATDVDPGTAVTVRTGESETAARVETVPIDLEGYR